MFPAISRYKFALAWFCTGVVGIGVGVANLERARTAKLDELRADALRCAVAFRPEELRTLSGSRDDLENPNYAAIKERLVRLHDVHPSVRFVYIFRSLPHEGKIIYLADSEPPGSKDLS